MSKFKNKTKVKQSIPTSSMPDVVFMLLFFFMVTTELRKTSIQVAQHIPQATQLRKLQRKSLVTNLYIGEPKKTELFGKEPKVQVDDAFIGVQGRELILWVSRERDKLAENEREQLTIALKVDENAKRGIITDVETQLRKASARKILYAAIQKTPNRR